MKKPPVEDLLRKLLKEPLDTPPDWLVAWAEDLPQAHPRRVPRGLIQALTLTFDSWQMVPVGARSGPDRTRRMVFRAGSIDVDLEIEPIGGPRGRETQRVIRGQILDSGVPGGRTFRTGEVKLLRGRRAVACVALNERGDFTLPAVAAERYALYVEAPGFRCRVTALEL